MELWLVRHGLPERLETADGSPADPPLGERGREQARQLAGWLAGQGAAALYTSPLRRARETAAPTARSLGLEPRVEPGVAEFDRDAASYVPLEELKAEDPAAWKALVSNGFYLEGDAERFRATVVGALERVVAGHAGERVVVFCHGGVINAWTAHVLASPRLFLFEPAYAGVSRFLAARSGERTLLSLNETQHL